MHNWPKRRGRCRDHVCTTTTAEFHITNALVPRGLQAYRQTICTIALKYEIDDLYHRASCVGYRPCSLCWRKRYHGAPVSQSAVGLAYLYSDGYAKTLKRGTGKGGTGKRGTLKVWKSVTILKSKSYGAEIKTVYGGMVAMLKASVHQGMAASVAALRDEITLIAKWVGLRCYNVKLQRKRQRDTVYCDQWLFCIERLGHSPRILSAAD